MGPNQAVQLTPLARALGWARLLRQSATALRRINTPQPPRTPTEAAFFSLGGAAVRTLPPPRCAEARLAHDACQRRN